MEILVTSSLSVPSCNDRLTMTFWKIHLDLLLQRFQIVKIGRKLNVWI